MSAGIQHVIATVEDLYGAPEAAYQLNKIAAIISLQFPYMVKMRLVN